MTAVIATVLVVALVSGLAVAMINVSRRDHADMLDPAAEEAWLVERFAHRPRVGAFVRRRLDRTSAGGLMLTVAFVVAFATAAAVGLVLDMVNRSNGLAEADESVAEWGSEHATSDAIDVLEVVTELGGTPVLFVVLIAVGVVDFLRHRRRDVLLFLLTVGVGQVLLTNLLKLVVDRERPSVLQLTGASGASFPSGHSASAAACWAAVALVLTRRSPQSRRAIAAGVAVFIAMGVAASRALLGVHWVTDVVAGVALGWGWFTLVAIAFGGRLQRFGEPAERVAGERLPPGPALTSTDAKASTS